MYAGRPSPADLCNYRTVDGTGRPVQIQHGSSWTVQFCSEGGFLISSILHGSTRSGVPVARVGRPGGLDTHSEFLIVVVVVSTGYGTQMHFMFGVDPAKGLAQFKQLNEHNLV